MTAVGVRAVAFARGWTGSLVVTNGYVESIGSSSHRRCRKGNRVKIARSVAAGAAVSFRFRLIAAGCCSHVSTGVTAAAAAAA